jgi:biopolymer transport protein ExbD
MGGNFSQPHGTSAASTSLIPHGDIMIRAAQRNLLPMSHSSTYSCVLLLLVLLVLIGKLPMLVRNTFDYQQSLSIPMVDLPKVSGSPFNKEIHQMLNDNWGEISPALFVTVDRSGRIYINHQIVAADRFRDELRNLQIGELQRGKDFPRFLYLKADKDLTFGKFYEIYKVAQSLSIGRIMLIVQY